MGNFDGVRLIAIRQHQHRAMRAQLQPQQLRVFNLSANQCHQLHQAQAQLRPIRISHTILETD